MRRLSRTFAAEWERRRFGCAPGDEEWRGLFRGEFGRILTFEDALRRWRAEENRQMNRVEGTIRVWLDDVHEAPVGWTRAYTAHEAIALLAAGGVVEISLDHDLGDDEKHGTGYTVACWIEERVAVDGFEPPMIKIHSANSVGRARMQRAVESIERLGRPRTP